ncbi:prolipoprotein diacylglyceryl transferase [Porphyrobacter algicida]|uniref:Phosphatidylglycerol--prolipoprotein diacylglyceryl transferase n=1 Tax=Qipengyuania algicida TaxID=1836209 RepID=A0A845AFJ8_9SPHN|nr:prolipoprotein diacylglyceryl transferase [Qipengyuania algicida]MXP28199.1 prolipoprotein diacylglyceryl transferase [Qipengyuania algicida]
MLSLLAASGSGHYLAWSSLGLKPGIDLGFFTLRWYSLAYLSGILLGYWHLSKMLKVPGAPMAQRHADDLFFYCTLGIILGGRLGFALFYKPMLFTDFNHPGPISWGLVRLWDGGMSFHGGVIGVLIAITWVAWRNKLNWLRICDYIAVNVPFGMFFGRIANFINGELWGRATDVPWAMTFCDIEHTANTCISSFIPRHPSQLYEAGLEGLAMGVIMLLLFWKTRARYRPGLMVGAFTVGIACARFINEFFREPDSYLEWVLKDTGLSRGQWLTLPMIAIGLAVIAYSLTRKTEVVVKEEPKPE